jgi:predicted N-formylglutamate amidohydrolase
VPGRLGDLGLGAHDLERHIAWDIGVLALGERLAARLDAPFIHQRFSRLVADCNRRPGAEDWAPARSDGSRVPGNEGLSNEDAEARLKEIFWPYHRAIAATIAERRRAGRPTLIVSLHSFTPRFQGQSRPWLYGVLHRGDSPLSARTLQGLRSRADGPVGDNQPYAMDGVDFTVPHHADRDGLDYLELEVRQDLLADEQGAAAAAALLGEVLLDILSSDPPLAGRETSPPNAPSQARDDFGS